LGCAVVVAWVGGGGTGEEDALVAVVEAFATPRKRWRVDGRGRAMGLRKRRGIEGEAIMLRLSYVPIAIDLEKQRSQGEPI
jgi:hypothetical protein